MSEDLYFDLEWIVRKNPEMDDKIVCIAKDILKSPIKKEQLVNSDLLDNAAVQVIIDIMSERVESFYEMTNDEIEWYIMAALVACSIIVALEGSDILDNNSSKIVPND